MLNTMGEPVIAFMSTVLPFSANVPESLHEPATSKVAVEDAWNVALAVIVNVPAKSMSKSFDSLFTVNEVAPFPIVSALAVNSPAPWNVAVPEAEDIIVTVPEDWLVVPAIFTPPEFVVPVAPIVTSLVPIAKTSSPPTSSESIRTSDCRLTVLVVPFITTVPRFCFVPLLSVRLLPPVPSKVQVPVPFTYVPPDASDTTPAVFILFAPFI